MSVVYSIRWRLIFIDGRVQDELPAGSPIADRWPNPVELHLIDLAGNTVQGIAIPPNHKPVFYRQRSITQRTDGVFGDTQLDATVFGYGCENGSKVDGELWMWKSGKSLDCPPEHIAQRAIELQLQA